MLPAIPAFQHYCSLARAAHPSLPSDTVAANVAAANRVLLDVSYEDLSKDQIVRMIASALHSGNLDILHAFEAFWNTTRAERAAWAQAFPDTEDDDFFSGMRIRVPHDRFAVKPAWGGAPHPDAARLWIQVRNEPSASPYHALALAYDAYGYINHAEHHGPQHDAMLQSLLLIPGPWSEERTEHSHPITRIGKMMMNPLKAVLPTSSMEAIHTTMQRSSSYDEAMLAAYAHQPTYGSLAILRAYASQGLTISALHQSGVATRTYPSVHACSAKVLALPEPAYLRALMDQPEGWRKASNVVKVAITSKAKRKKMQRGQHHADTPEALAKRAARAAKKAQHQAAALQP